MDHAFHNVVFVVDTVAPNIYLKSAMMKTVQEAMIRNGAIPIIKEPGQLLQYSNCPKPEALPSLKFVLGASADAFNITLTARDYLEYKSFAPASCLLYLTEFRDDEYILVGARILSKLLTVFDHTKHRLGFCKIRD